MSKPIFCLILLVTLLSKNVLCDNYLKSYDGKIVGGLDTTIDMYPYQAQLLVTNGANYYRCGGSIISNHYIVTAAHCLTGMKTVYVRIGSTAANSGGAEYKSTSFYKHPFYNARTNDYDIGIVKTEEKMKLDEVNATTIKLVDSGVTVKDNETLVVTGWGLTEEDGYSSSTLRVVEVPAVSRKLCNEQYNGTTTITSRMICAGLPEGGKDACEGDSGGPAVVKTTGLLVGVTSFGLGCARPNIPGVYSFIGNEYMRLFIRLITGI